MSTVLLPPGYRLEALRHPHARSAFRCGQAKVDEWLAHQALQHRDKHLSATKVLVDQAGSIAGFYTLATAQVDFGALPPELVRRLPRRALPVTLLAWLGVQVAEQGKGLGRRLLAQALRDSHDAGQTFPLIAVILDCIDDRALAFYRRWDFRPLPGHRNRLFLSWSQLAAMVAVR
ncbi:MAG: GNAT family N-acetyltransferase [Chromatiaceae bacterium]